MKHERYTANHYALPMCQAIPTEITPCKSIVTVMSDEYGWVSVSVLVLDSSLYVINQRKLYIVGMNK